MTFVYGETGWPRGGRFRPHRTHQNRLSVYLMVPVRGGDGRPARLPTPPWRKFGYATHFDAAVELVIVAPEYRPALARTPSGAVLARLPLMRGRPWVRHDEHYHVDFPVRPPSP